MSLPLSMKAYKVQGKGVAKVVECPLPELRKDYVLVKISCVGLNPTDWKHIAGIPKEGATVGCDYSGTVVEVGSAVKKDWKKGDRIMGFTHGVNSVQPEDGCFAEYAVAKGDIQMRIPDDLSDEEAATMGVGLVTIGQGMYQSLQLPPPDAPTKDKTPLLIYGGSTGMGLFALQFAQLSGLRPIVTCSPHNNELVKSYGAEAVFDYRDKNACAKQIREAADNNLKHAFDCISEGTSPEICGGALASGGQYSSLLPADPGRHDIKSGYTLGYTVMGEFFTFRGGTEWPAKPEDYEFGKQWIARGEKLIADGKINAPPIDFREGGLEAIHEGLDDLKQGRVSGKKIVYQVS